jgi:hypothetical protein
MKVRLADIAHARSGDKGDTANVGVIALRREWYDLIARELTERRVADHFRGVITGAVQRYELPNLAALNFLLHGALDGGGTLSLKTDAQGKVFSTALLRMVLDVPDAEARSLALPVASWAPCRHVPRTEPEHGSCDSAQGRMRARWPGDLRVRRSQ